MTEDIRARSVIAEEKWMMGEDTNQAPSVIPMLTTLDEHNFYTAQQGWCLFTVHRVHFTLYMELNVQLCLRILYPAPATIPPGFLES